MKIKIGFLLLSVSLFGCVNTPEINTTTTALPTTSAGLTALTSQEIDENFTGVIFESVDGGWTWEFQDDGLAQAKADDGSWETVDQKWSIEDGQLCRSLGETYPCVNLYKVGNTFLFGKPDTEELETWSITKK